MNPMYDCSGSLDRFGGITEPPEPIEDEEPDWPFVITAMRTVANTLELSMDESGKLWTKQLSEHTSGIMIDATELKKQMEEEKDAGI